MTEATPETGATPEAPPEPLPREARPKPVLDAVRLRDAVMRRLPKKTATEGRMRLPAVPSLADHYVECLGKTFAAFGRVFSEKELGLLKQLLSAKLEEGFAASPYSYVLVRYATDAPPKTSLSYWLSTEISTMEDQYADWVKTRTPPLFGSHPDTKVMDLARSLGPAAEATVLDIGAGTGRNTLPLARAGHPTDAVEMSPDLARILRRDAEAEALPIRLYQGDALAEGLELERERYRLIILCEVVSHFRTTLELRRLFERTRELLAPGGLLCFSAFLPVGGYQRDQLAFELSQVFWCTLFTREELKAASAELGFSLISEESVCEYEKKHLPEKNWPPTGWFEEWTRGVDLFRVSAQKSPIDMRWLVYRKGA